MRTAAIVKPRKRAPSAQGKCLDLRSGPNPSTRPRLVPTAAGKESKCCVHRLAKGFRFVEPASVSESVATPECILFYPMLRHEGVVDGVSQ